MVPPPCRGFRAEARPISVALARRARRNAARHERARAILAGPRGARMRHNGRSGAAKADGSRRRLTPSRPSRAGPEAVRMMGVTTTDDAVPAMREERKAVTAVFADVVGSTALGERLDPEEIRLIVGEAISRT